MKLWTYHPPDFRIDDPELHNDPSRGRWWNDPALCYESSLRRLCEMIGTDDFPLWCLTLPDSRSFSTYESKWSIEWELDVPEGEILAFINARPWDSILRQESHDWDNVIIKEKPFSGHSDISAVTRLPLSPECAVICHGPHVRKEWRDKAEELRNRPERTKRRHIQLCRDRAASSTNECQRHRQARLADYLEETWGLKEP